MNACSENWWMAKIGLLENIVLKFRPLALAVDAWNCRFRQRVWQGYL